MKDLKGRLHRGLGGTVILGAAALCPAAAHAGALPEIAVTCRVGPGVDAARGAEICDGFLQALPQIHPDRRFVTGSTTPPAMEVVAIRASPTSAGFDLTWHLPDGRKIAGKPFQISMMDRRIDAGKLTGLYHSFLGFNPLPF